MNNHTQSSRGVVAIVAFGWLIPAATLAADENRSVTQVPAAQATDAGSAALRMKGVASIFANDVAAINDAAYEGKSRYLTDLLRRQSVGGCMQYCIISVRQGVEGRLREAIRSAGKALHLAQEGVSGVDRSVTKDFLFAYSKRDLASAYNLAGKDEVALRLANESIEHQKQIRIAPSEILVPMLRVRGDVYLRRGEAKKAIVEYENALSNALRSQKAFVLEALIPAYLAAGDLERVREAARDLSDEASPGLQQAGQIGLGAVALREHNADKAIEHFSAALKVERGAWFRRLASTEGLAKAQLLKGDRKQAIVMYVQAIDGTESLRGQIRGEEFRAGVFGQFRRIFDDTVKLLMEDGRVEEAWNVSERGRARAFLDLVRRGVFASYAAAAASEPTNKTASLTDITDQLSPNDVLIQFHVVDRQTYIWTIRKSGIQAATVDIGKQDLASRVDSFRRAIVDRSSSVNELAEALFDVLLKPLNLKENEHLIIVTHDSLHYLPFQALRRNGAYLIENNVISYAPTASVLIDLLKKPKLKTERLLALGNPDLDDPSLALPGAEKEVKHVQSLFSAPKVLIGSQATKTAFLNDAGASDVVHIAAHAHVDPIDPMYSRILLAGTDVIDRELEAHEIYLLNMTNTRLVTLSACETALGRVTAGDEVWGFTRAFLGAGARSVVVSLWQVADESTEELMSKFYGALAHNDLRGALRKAQRDVIANRRFSHPYFWAAFNLIGDSR